MPLKKKTRKKPFKKKLLKKKPLKKRPLKKKPAKKKIVRRKPTAKKTAKKARKLSAAEKKIRASVIGKVTHYFPKVRAAVVKLKVPLSVGDTIKIKGHTTDFTQTVVSLQIDRVPLNKAQKGAVIGLLVESRVRRHDTVYKA